MAAEAKSPLPPNSSEADRLIPGTKITWPSLSYKEACSSYTYRVSEQVFGSLLASYILGFVSFGMAAVGGIAVFKAFPGIFDSLKFYQICQYLIISASFSYLTAAYYVTYHNSILTMPPIPNHKLGADFGIALLQAVLFGLSMIRPDAFLLFLGLSWLRVFSRQYGVFCELARHFQISEEKIDTRAERTRFQTALQGVNENKKFQDCLEGWMPIEGKKWFIAILMCVLGLLSEARHHFGPISKVLSFNELWMMRVEVVVYLVVFVLIAGATNGIFRKRASHSLIKEGAEVKGYAIDHAALALVNKLR